MLNTILLNIISCDPSTIGLVFGFIGALIITVFGVPPISLLNEGAVFEIKLTKRMRINIWVSRIGLLLVAIGFILQLIAVPLAK